MQRLRQALDEKLAGVSYASSIAGPWACLLGHRRMGHAGAIIVDRGDNRAGIESDTKPHAFVAMPFLKDMDDVFYYGIQGPIHRPACCASGLTRRLSQEISWPGSRRGSSLRLW